MKTTKKSILAVASLAIVALAPLAGCLTEVGWDEMEGTWKLLDSTEPRIYTIEEGRITLLGGGSAALVRSAWNEVRIEGGEAIGLASETYWVDLHGEKLVLDSTRLARYEFGRI